MAPIKITGGYKINISIARIGQNQTVGYAARELSRYLKQMDPALWVDLRVYDAYSPEVEKVLWLGIDGFYAQYKDKTGPSWEFLKHHANFTKQYADTLAAYLGDGHTPEERETEKQKLMNLCYELEPFTHEGLDSYKFKDIFRRYWDKFCTAE